MDFPNRLVFPTQPCTQGRFGRVDHLESTVIKGVGEEAILYAATINEHWSFTLHFHCDLQGSLIHCVHVQIGVTLIKLFMNLLYGSPVFYQEKPARKNPAACKKRRPFWIPRKPRTINQVKSARCQPGCCLILPLLCPHQAVFSLTSDCYWLITSWSFIRLMRAVVRSDQAARQTDTAWWAIWQSSAWCQVNSGLISACSSLIHQLRSTRTTHLNFSWWIIRDRPDIS